MSEYRWARERSGGESEETKGILMKHAEVTHKQNIKQKSQSRIHRPLPLAAATAASIAHTWEGASLGR